MPRAALMAARTSSHFLFSFIKMQTGSRTWAGILLVLGLAAAGPAFSDWALNMPRGATTISREVFDLHMMVLWVCTIIGVGVYGAMVYALIRFRKSAGAQPAKFTHNTKAEVIWTTIPALILVARAVPSAETLIRMEDARGSEITIQVTGYQWRWHYDYIDDGVRFFSSLDAASNDARRLRSGIDPATVDNYLLEVDNPVVVPVDTKVRLLITAADVLHSWWVPDFAVKKDAVPGFINEVWFEATETGTYRGQCAELCGRDHAFMPIVVNVVGADEYTAWLEERREETASRVY